MVSNTWFFLYISIHFIPAIIMSRPLLSLLLCVCVCLRLYLHAYLWCGNSWRCNKTLTAFWQRAWNHSLTTTFYLLWWGRVRDKRDKRGEKERWGRHRKREVKNNGIKSAVLRVKLPPLPLSLLLHIGLLSCHLPLNEDGHQSVNNSTLFPLKGCLFGSWRFTKHLLCFTANNIPQN